MQTVHGEDAHHLGVPELDIYVTARAGMLAPVIFHLPGRDVSPYALAPWQPAEYPDIPPLLSVLRGDFLCLPFGSQVDGPPHGDPANAVWKFVSQDERSLRLSMDASDSGAHIEKILSTQPGHHAVYAEHRISNLEGDFSYGNHPVLDLSGLKENEGRISTSAFHWASVFPGSFSDPNAGETGALAGGSAFTDLSSVRLAHGGSTDLTRYPARGGNDDLVMMAHVPTTEAQPFAWSAAVLDGYLWFSLKDPAEFPSTVLWISNGGRTAAPWLGRHTARIGIEDVCSHFSNGVDLSRRDLLAEHGVPTTRKFERNQTVALRTIQAVAAVPADFGAVTSIAPAGESAVVITGETGRHLTVPVDWRFVVD